MRKIAAYKNKNAPLSVSQVEICNKLRNEILDWMVFLNPGESLPNELNISYSEYKRQEMNYIAEPVKPKGK